jgi:hypothetical protein
VLGGKNSMLSVSVAADVISNHSFGGRTGTGCASCSGGFSAMTTP